MNLQTEIIGKIIPVGKWVKNEERPYDCYLKSLHGVSLNDKSRAERLELANNNLQGTIPDELINLSDLQIFDISDNQLSGSLPDFLSNTRLSDFYIQSNYFTCGDLQPLIGNFSPLEYSPQKYMHNGPEFYPAQSSNDLISLSAPFNDSGNITYSWYKNGTLIENENDSTLHLNNIQLEDLGWYSLHIVKNDCVESNGIISSVTFISDSIKVGNYFPHKNLTFAAYFLKKK